MKRTTTQRGYGYAHQKARAQWRRLIDSDGATCVRCGGYIPPGAPFDLDHSDDRTYYNGPAHETCNRRAGSRKWHDRLRNTRPERPW